MKFLYLPILFSCALNLYSQKPKQVLEWINTVQSETKNFYFEISFEYRNNQIVLPVTIGKQVYSYIFDTGGYNDITDDIQKINNFAVLATQRVGSSNGIKSNINLVKVDSLKIGQLVFHDIAALQMNFDNSPTIKCTIDGALIGASLIKNYIWQIDFSRKKIIVSDQLSKITLPDGSVKIPVTYNSRLMPFIEATIDKRKEKFLLDLGSSTLFSLTEKSALKYISSKETIQVDGMRSEGGNGTLIQTATIFKAGVVELSAFKFTNKPVLYTHSGVENIIGNPLIKYFIVTLNFKGDELYLSPIPGTQLPDGWNSYGFIAEYKNGQVLVTSLFKGLSAEKAGLKIGDEIISINGQPVDCKNYCSCMVALAKALDENTKLLLVVRNGQNEYALSVVKDKVF